MEPIRVLAVDDEPGMRSGLKRALRDFSFRMPDVNDDVSFVVDDAETAEDAFDKIEASPPDIMLLDYKLPGMSGLDLLEKISGRDYETVTIMITAYASIETAVVATKRGAYDFLVKPFTPDELKQVVQKAASRLILSRQARQLSDERKRVRFEFIRVLGHELKAPLGAVEGYLNILDARTLGPIPDEYDIMIKRSKVRLEGMRKLIADLLDMTRIESGEKQRQLAQIDVRESAESAIETAQPAATERGTTINLDMEPISMWADRGEIEIVLNNLISNAVKYNRENGRVDVKITRDHDVVTLSVTDTGIGMSEEDVARLFHEFVRIKNAKTRDILGSGLGLSIIKKIADIYDGETFVTSTPDVGSTFAITLKDAPPKEGAESSG